MYIVVVAARGRRKQTAGKREEEAASSNRLLGLKLEGREEGVRCTQAQQLSKCMSNKLSS